MKLKRVDKEKDDWQKCCRYCHHYSNGKCFNKNNPIVFEEDSIAVYKVAEDGYLDQCLEETLDSIKLSEFKELEFLLRGYKLSEKRIKEFNSLFQECWEDFLQNTLKPELEENVSRCYINNLESRTSFNGLYIKDPENYCCKEWC